MHDACIHAKAHAHNHKNTHAQRERERERERQYRPPSERVVTYESVTGSRQRSMRRKTSTCTPEDLFISLTDIADLHSIRRQFFAGATDLAALICAEARRSRQSRAFTLHSTRRQPRLAPRAPASDSEMGALGPRSRARAACFVALIFAQLTCSALTLAGPCMCTYI